MLQLLGNYTTGNTVLKKTLKSVQCFCVAILFVGRGKIVIVAFVLEWRETGLVTLGVGGG